MLLKTIVCSGVNEKNKIDEAVDFLKKYPNVEFGVQCSPKKAGFGTERFDWLEALTTALDEAQINGRVALHLNEGFAVSFADGIVPDEVSSILSKTSAIGRLQLNFKLGREVFENGRIAPNLSKLQSAIEQVDGHKLIMSASKANLPLIAKMHHRKMKFDALFDDSFGEGLLPKSRQEPLFDDVFQGYAGGISPENVACELEKIAKVATGAVFIDAEGKLKDTGVFSIEKAEQYVQNALLWHEQNPNQIQKAFFKSSPHDLIS